MANRFGTDILIQSQDPQSAAKFYVDHLGFEIAEDKPNMVSLCGELGPVLEVTVASIEEARERLVKQGCRIVKDEPEFPRCYIKDRYGLIYNLTS